MMSRPLPHIRWIPGDKSPRIISSDVIPKSFVSSVMGRVFGRVDADDIIRELKLSREEFLVAVFFECAQRPFNHTKIRRPFLIELYKWALNGYEFMRMRKDIPWPPPSYKGQR